MLNRGNPAATVLLTSSESSQLSDTSRQALAKELNLSETAYVTRGDAENRFGLRWFTPKVEVRLCGHATLAAAAALVRHGWVSWGTQVVFETLSGELRVETPADECSDFRMEFPALYTEELRDEQVRKRLIEGLGLEEGQVESVLKSEYDGVVVVKDGGYVRGLMVDTEVLKDADEMRGVIVAAKEGKGFVSRFFAPRVGIEEDAVTGSAHCVLATLFVGIGEEVEALQVSERGGWLKVGRRDERVVGLSGIARVVICGHVEV